MSCSKTLLIVTTTFYPHRVVGAVRVTQWCRHLAEFGWKPVVLCRYFGARATPEELAEHVHPELELHYFNAPSAAAGSGGSSKSSGGAAEPKRAVVKQWIAGTVGRVVVPDTSRFFWHSARQKTVELFDHVQPQAVLTSSPPHSNHDIGLWLSRVRPNTPWIADFRDPYLIDSRYQPRGLGTLVAPLHRSYERRIYEQAALVVHAIPLQGRWARLHYPNARKRIKILTNGCPADLTEGRLDPVDSPNGVRSIRVMGATDHAQREQLVRATEALVTEGQNVELRLIGRRRPDEEALAARLNERFVATGQLAHRDALRQLLGGDVLVNVLSPVRSEVMGISSKLFEFLACGRPMVVINPTRTDRQLIGRFQGVRALTHPSDRQVEEALRWALGSEAMPSPHQTARARREFSRRNQTLQLAQWLDQTIGSAD